MRRALLLSSILAPLAVAGASNLLRHHGERSALLEGAHFRPPSPHSLPFQAPVSLLLRVYSSHWIFCVWQVRILVVSTTTTTLKDPLAQNFINFRRAVSVSCVVVVRLRRFAA